MLKSGEISEESIKAGYEVSDIQVKLIVVSVVALFIMLFSGVIFGVIYLRFMESSTSIYTDKPVHPMSAAVKLPAPEPPLQMNPEADKRVYIEAVRERLNSYGQVVADSAGGEGVARAHIPIERAMELVASGKAPYRQEPVLALEAADGIFEEDAPAEGN